MFKKYSIPRWLIFLIDNFMVFITFIIAYLLRFNFELGEFSSDLAIRHAGIALGTYMVFSLIIRPFSGLIRHTTIIDIIYIFFSTSSSLLSLLVLSFLGRNLGWNPVFILPYSIIIIHYGIISLVLIAIRILIKTTYHFVTSSLFKKKRVLVFGAGAMGIIVKRVLNSDVKSEYHLVGFLDNNKKLQGKKINGIPIYNPEVLARKFVEKYNIQSMIFAIVNISQNEKSQIISSALNVGLEVLDTPTMDTWLNGQFRASQIRRVNLEDLLGREPIKLNLTRIMIGLSGKTILVTGAAGSIGSEMVRQLTHFQAKSLILVDQAETPMFHLENELNSIYSQCDIKCILADVTVSEKMERIFHEFHPDIVFHAAAYKHVPLLEENPHEAIRINIGGIIGLTRLSVKYGVKKFVMVSTDKAVNPTNIMGATKRLCEMVVQLAAKDPDHSTQFITTRFGNVLGSNGSVIPLFSKQIERGGPVTVTHPDITRYFMTIPEACQLVLEAGFMGSGGEIFVFDMGEPVKIVDLARQMIRLSGLEPDKDIKIEFTGLRPGEKLYEELLSSSEHTKPTHQKKIRIAIVQENIDNHLFDTINDLLIRLYTLSKDDVVNYLRRIVPEFIGKNKVNANSLTE